MLRAPSFIELLREKMMKGIAKVEAVGDVAVLKCRANLKENSTQVKSSSGELV